MAWRGRRGLIAGLGVAAEIPGAPVLPFDGGLLDQPDCLLTAFEIMDEAAATTRAAVKEED